MKQKIYVVGIGPGAHKMMTPQARQALEESDVIAGYPVYLKLLGDLVQNKKTIATPMTKEEEKLRRAHEEIFARIASYLTEGKIVAFLTIGDPVSYTHLRAHET